MKITYAKFPREIVEGNLEEEIIKEGKEFIFPLRLYGQPDFTFKSPVKIKLGQNEAEAKKNLHKFCKALIHAGLMEAQVRVGVLYHNSESIRFIAKAFSDEWCDLSDFKVENFEKIKNEVKTLRPCF